MVFYIFINCLFFFPLSLNQLSVFVIVKEVNSPETEEGQPELSESDFLAFPSLLIRLELLFESSVHHMHRLYILCDTILYITVYRFITSY